MLMAGVVVVSSATAQQVPNRAGLVVRFGDQRTETRCVEFSEPEITGLELLERSGLGLAVDYQAGGAAICSINDTGCPADDCFCQCAGGADCVYWSFWQHQSNGWRYSAGGAGVIIVRDGELNGWSWGPGSVTEAIPPQETSFDEICVAAAPSTPTFVPTSPPLVLPTLPAQGGGEATATATTAPTMTVTAAAQPTESPTMAATATSAAVMTAPAAATQMVATATTAANLPLATTLPMVRATSTPEAQRTQSGQEAEAGQEGMAVAAQTDSRPPTATPEPSLPAAAPASDGEPRSDATTILNSNENDSQGEPSTDNVVVIGAAAGAPVHVAQIAGNEQVTGDNGFPAAEYALFAALGALLGALFGLAFLRRRAFEERGG